MTSEINSFISEIQELSKKYGVYLDVSNDCQGDSSIVVIDKNSKVLHYVKTDNFKYVENTGIGCNDGYPHDACSSCDKYIK